MTIIIPTIDDDATDAQAPLDSWLEASVRAQVEGLLSSAGEACGAWDTGHQRWVDLDDGTIYQDNVLWTARPAVIALVPVRLPAGAESVTVRVSGRLVVQPDEASPATVTLWVGWEGEDVRRDEAVLTPGTDDAWLVELTADVPEGRVAVGGERVATLYVWAWCRLPSAAYATGAGWRPGGLALVRAAAVTLAGLTRQVSAGQALIVRATNPSLQSYAETLAELANSPDLATSSEEYDQVALYDSVGVGETQLTVDVYNLTGLKLDTIGASIACDAEALLTEPAIHRAGIVVEGVAHSGLDDLIQYAQDAPQLLLARPRGDVVADTEVSVMRAWRCAWGALVPLVGRTTTQPILLDELVVCDRDYGWLDVQLRLVAVNPIAADDVEVQIWGGASTWRDGVTPGAPVDALLTTGEIRLDALAPRGPGVVLRDLARYYTPTPLAINGRSLLVAGNTRPIALTGRRTDQGYRLGVIRPDELPLVQTIAVAVPVPATGDAGLVRVRVLADPRASAVGSPDERLWARQPETLIAVVGASVTWRGR